ncbi:DUF4238 domain-containing protein [Hyphococcus sp.]|uniref:DUF4238 domain-containing protein n=1 Tax=Hyphococcus sp. TaxID=2038636 RepID=UPI0035C7443E
MKKRHHFVPQFYLRNFAAHNPEEEIWTYDMERGTARGSTIENTAYEKYLYSVTSDDGVRQDDLENVIAAIEDKAAPVFEKVILAEKITGQERANFSSFIAIMYVRTDAFRQQYAEAMMGMHQITMHATAAHDGAFKSFSERFQKDKGKMTEAEIEEMREAMLNLDGFTISIDKEWTLRSLTMHDSLAPIFFDMHWSVLEAEKPRYFIASDNPVIFDVPAAYRHPIYGGGLSHKKVELTFPLSPSKCLLATWDKSLPQFSEIPREAVKHMNRMRATYARRFLFGPYRDDGIVKLGIKYKDTKPGMKISGFGPKEYAPVEMRRRKPKPNTR